MHIVHAEFDYWQWLRAPTSIRQSSHLDHLASSPDWHIDTPSPMAKKGTGESNPFLICVTVCTILVLLIVLAWLTLLIRLHDYGVLRTPYSNPSTRAKKEAMLDDLHYCHDRPWRRSSLSVTSGLHWPTFLEDPPFSSFSYSNTPILPLQYARYHGLVPDYWTPSYT